MGRWRTRLVGFQITSLERERSIDSGICPTYISHFPHSRSLSKQLAHCAVRSSCLCRVTRPSIAYRIYLNRNGFHCINSRAAIVRANDQTNERNSKRLGFQLPVASCHRRCRCRSPRPEDSQEDRRQPVNLQPSDVESGRVGEREKEQLPRFNSCVYRELGFFGFAAATVPTTSTSTSTSP